MDKNVIRQAVGFCTVLLLVGSFCTLGAVVNQRPEAKNLSGELLLYAIILGVVWLTYISAGFMGSLVMILDGKSKVCHLIALFALIAFFYFHTVIPGGFSSSVTWYNLFLMFIFPAILMLDMEYN